MTMPRPPDREKPILGLVAFIFVFLLVMFLGVVVLVGAFEVDPRRAALFVIAPAFIVALGAALYGPTRTFFARIVILT